MPAEGLKTWGCKLVTDQMFSPAELSGLFSSAQMTDPFSADTKLFSLLYIEFFKMATLDILRFEDKSKSIYESKMKLFCGDNLRQKYSLNMFQIS